MVRIKNIKIGYKLIAFFILLGIGSLISLSLYFFRTSEDAILDRTFQQLTSVHVVKKRQLESFFDERVRENEQLATSKEINKKSSRLFFEAKTFHQQNESAFLDRYNKYIAGHFKNDTDHQSITLISPYRALRIIPGDTSLVNYLKYSTIDEPLYQDLWKSVSENRRSVIRDFTSADSLSLLIASPVFLGKYHPEGMIVSEVALSSINNIMLENSSSSGLGQSGESYLVGADNLMRSSSRFQDNSVLNTKVETPAVKESLMGISSTSIIQDYRDIKVLSSYGPLDLPDLNWVILAEIDYREAIAPVIQIRNDILFMGVMLSIIIIGLSVFFSRYITLPLINLKKMAEKVEKGDFNVRLSTDKKDEVGKLTLAFNRMTSQISQQTNELKEREQRLRQFYKATTDGIFLHRNQEAVLVNDALESLTGYSQKELMKMKLQEVVKNLPDVDTEDSLETKARRKDGSEFEVELKSSRIDYDGQSIEACIIRDITRRKMAERLLAIERERRLASVFGAQELERQRVSRELHDGLGQRLAGLKLAVEEIKSSTNNNSLMKLDTIEQYLTEAIQETRQISYNLMPPELYDFGLSRAIHQFCIKNTNNSTININFNKEGHEPGLSKEQKVYLFRICQEALNNAIKHSSAKRIEVQIAFMLEYIVLIVEDNGLGFDKTEITYGNGIYNIRERVSLLKGNVSMESSPGKGTVIYIRIPYKTEVNGPNLYNARR
ncbi:MAG: PAS domain S-box protein [Bacteroidales bacterium]|nr:PAS domain S-box protein [Bacteroidales bacterium]